MIANRCSWPSQAATGIKLQILFDRPCTFNGNPIKLTNGAVFFTPVNESDQPAFWPVI